MAKFFHFFLQSEAEKRESRIESTLNSQISNSIGVGEAVPDSYNRRNVIRVGNIILQFYPQRLDVYTDSIRKSIGPRTPYVFEQIFLADHLARVAHQVFEDAKLFASELDPA